MIAPVMHHHVRLRWHMAIDALCAGASRRMLVMRGDVELFRQVALGTQGAAFSAQLCGVRFMTIGADDAGFMHGALKKGVILEHLAVDLSVRMIKPWLQESRQSHIEE